VVHDRAHRYLFSSWNTIYGALLAEFPSQRYRLGQEVVALRRYDDGVELAFRSGERSRAELVVCADGIGSTARATLLPDVAPAYSGYVAWRGTVPEEELSPATFDALADAITYQVLPDSHILVYPIPGPSGSLLQGERLMNFVWYRNVAAGAEFDALMTDRAGRLRPVSLPPGGAKEASMGCGPTRRRPSRRWSPRSSWGWRSRSCRPFSTSRCRGWRTVGCA
jgi:2,6-dihydroxypyridine 3-monooxygenase